MSKATLNAKPPMSAALASYYAAENLKKRERDAELAETQAARANVRETVNLAKSRGEEVEYVDRGPVRIISRDGLLWLVAKKRLTHALRDAAERYRKDFGIIHGGHLRSCVDGRIGGAGTNSLEVQTKARRDLEKARVDGLGRDGPLIWLMDEIAGKGATLMELAKQDDRHAGRLEVEFRVACRLLARHYGLST